MGGRSPGFEFPYFVHQGWMVIVVIFQSFRATLNIVKLDFETGQICFRYRRTDRLPDGVWRARSGENYSVLQVGNDSA
jgi:hypothetical protein